MKTFRIILIVLVLIPFRNAGGQVSYALDVDKCKDSISCIIRLEVPAKSYGKIRKSRGIKPECREVRRF